MAITSAAIEANGWVLLVTMTGSPSAAGDFSGYALDPNGTPRLVVTSSAPGFAVSGGGAVAATAPRSLIATKPLRLPVVATAAGVRNAKTPDETNLGSGTIRIRIALSQHIYATDTGLTLTALAGWRTGEAAAAIAVTNNSTLAAPSPIVRWSDVPYQRIGSTTLIPLEVVAFAHHPNGVSPVAGVKFTVTDGTNTATAWATALSSSPKYAAGGTGVAARVYRAVVDASTATPGPLGEGLVRGDFKAFPWIGQAFASDSGDTALAAVAASRAGPMGTTLATDGFSSNAQTPFVVAYDPNGTWVPLLYVYVEPNTWQGTGSIAANVLTVATTSTGAVAAGAKISGVGVAAGCTVVAGSGSTWTVTATGNVGTIALQGGGTSVWTNVTVSSNPATASAGVCADGYTNARLAVGVLNRTIAARNGQPSVTKSTDGLITRYKAGTYLNLGANAVGTGTNCGLTWDIIEGDPADGNPRANIVIQTQSTFGGNTRAARCLFRNMKLVGTPGVASVPFSSSPYAWVDNCEARGPVGTATNTVPLLGNGLLAGYWTNSKVWQMGTGIFGVVTRNCQVEYGIWAGAILNNARLPTAIAGASAIGSPQQDVIIAGNDFRYIKGAYCWATGYLSNANAGAAALGTTYAVFTRQAVVNNVFETYGTSNPMFGAVGENNPAVATYSIVEGNTITGDRLNWLYDDLNLATIDANDTESNIMLCNRVANNAIDQHSIKHDFFNDPTVKAQRAGVALTATRSKVKAVGDEIVIAGSPATVYRCITAGTTASSGGPTGTGADITDGTVHWAWRATESRQHGYRPNAVRGWSALYGVGMLDNVVVRGNPDPEFLHEFEGLNTPNISVDGPAAPFLGDPKYTLDKSGTDVWTGTAAAARYNAANTGGGDYKPLAGSPLIAHSRAGNIDVDQRGAIRPLPFATGAVQNDSPVALVPAGTLQATRASSPALGLALAVAPSSAVMATRAAPSRVGWFVTLRAASAVMAMRAAASGVGWATTLTAASATMASRATASLAGWTTLLGSASGHVASRATTGLAAWAAALVPDAARVALRSSDGRIDWAALLAPANARSASAAEAGAIGVILPGAIAPDSCRVPVADRTLPTLLPGSVTPPERTLIVTGDFRTMTACD